MHIYELKEWIINLKDKGESKWAKDKLTDIKKIIEATNNITTETHLKIYEDIKGLLGIKESKIFPPTEVGGF